MDEIEQLTQKLMGFRSTHNRPEEISACLNFCAQFFDGLPVVLKRFESEGVPSLVIQTRDGTELDALFVGHIDVADAPERFFETRMQGKRMYGRSVVDMKAFVATSMIVLRDLMRGGYRGSIGLALVTDEELGGQNGSRYLVEDIGYRAKVVLVPDDGDDISTVVRRSKHMFTFTFTARGRAAHGNRPWDGVNAIELLLQTLGHLRKKFPSYEQKPPSNWVNTLNLGVIKGGLASNEVPAEAMMELDIRIVPPTRKEDVLKVVNDALAPGVTCKLTMEGAPMDVSEKNPYLASYCKVIEEVTGTKVRFKDSGGGTDARYFAARGMTAIVHQGTGGDAQGEDEYVEIPSLRQLVEIQKAFIIKMFN